MPMCFTMEPMEPSANQRIAPNYKPHKGAGPQATEFAREEVPQTSDGSKTMGPSQRPRDVGHAVSTNQVKPLN